MAKFYGKIGYAVRMEIRPGVWDDEIQYFKRNQYCSRSFCLSEFSCNAVCRVYGS